MIYLIAPGPLKYPFVKEGVSYFLKGLSKWIKVEGIFPRLKGAYSSKEERLSAEKELMIKHLPQNSYLIVLDERGRAFNTTSFTELLNSLQGQWRNITFLIGGPEGVSEELKKRAHLTLRLSDLTLNHEIALLVLVEALYRAFSIIKGHPYHRA